MRRHVVAAAALVVGLALPAAAAAKGPSSASISGPEISGRTISGQGEGGLETPLGALVDLGGFFSQVYGQTPDPTTRAQPRATLGPRYRVVYVLPGPNGVRSRLAQDVYPYAKPVPLTHMRRGQTFWDGQKTLGGWFRSSAALRRTLVKAGLPAAPPATTR